MLKNKNILITQPLIRGINGSTVVTLELAQTLRSFGASVTIYTCDYDNPGKKIFKDAHIKVVTSDEKPKFKLSEFDYIWVHSQILPISIIEELSNDVPKKIPIFIFLHMSGMDWIPDEKPWIYDLENKLSSLSLFISEEVKQVNELFLNSSVPTGFFRNPVPTAYKTRDKLPSDNLKQLLIVSSHPPEEVLKAKNILNSKYGVNVTILGEGQEKYTLFNKSLLEKYDAILTIAKTVPYCLVSGTPVYIYDSFGGGPGWLNKSNFQQAKERNFSGYQNKFFPNYEGGVFHYKKPEKIAEEIINGYQDSLKFHKKNKEKFYTDYVIDQVLCSLFKTIKKRQFEKFEKSYANSVIAAEQFATIRFKTGGELYNRDFLIHSLYKENDSLIKRANNLKNENDELKNYKKSVNELFNSTAYRLFDKVITPYKLIRKVFHK